MVKALFRKLKTKLIRQKNIQKNKTLAKQSQIQIILTTLNELSFFTKTEALKTFRIKLLV